MLNKRNTGITRAPLGPKCVAGDGDRQPDAYVHMYVYQDLLAPTWSSLNLNLLAAYCIV